MPPRRTRRKQAPLPDHWTQQHCDVHRDMQSTDMASIIKALIKYRHMKSTGQTDVPGEVVDIHIEVARHILEKEKGLNPYNLDSLVNKKVAAKTP
jgi:hypothetical protein